MNITLFGGTGKTGLLLIKNALNQSFNITVYARNTKKIKIEHERLKVIQGELNDLDSIENAINGADVVISLLGPTNNTNDLAIVEGMKNIISSMKKNNVRRLIATSTPSYRVENDKFQFGFSLAVFFIKTFMKRSYQNIVLSSKLIEVSDLDWTIIRLPMLSDSPKKEKINIGYTGEGKVKLFSLTRINLASFLLYQINDNSYYKKAPIISN